jgi:hypothetical protein
MMNNEELTLIEKNNTFDEAWTKSRSGAWASRGFHHQHLVSTLILIRQWAGLAPSGYLIPEGLEDSVIEISSQEFWLQIKSRKEGDFSKREVDQILSGVNAKAAAIKANSRRKVFVVLEKPCSGLKNTDIGQIFDSKNEQIFVCDSPSSECIQILTNQLEIAEVIAEGIVSDLYKLVASASEENTSVSFENRRRISTTEVTHRIFERLEAEDSSAIDSALASGIVETIDFNIPVTEASFYMGVKVKPGHVAAGLVLERPLDRENVTKKLRQRRQVLLTGPSGAGKSALLWLSVNDLVGEFRWYQISPRAVSADAGDILRFIRSRRPTEISPIALAFDEVGSTGADLWNVLDRELRSLPSVYFLGSIRREDTPLISNHADTEFIEVSLNEKLAENVWRKLITRKKTNWNHWREPFEQSESLMLEYVHILTQGKRLADVIGEQVRQRQAEGRNDELAIIRSTAVLSAHGGEVQVSKLISSLDINPDKASNAFSRLINEHLVREIRPGILGGMHILRSKALSQASHDEIVYLSEDSLWKSFGAVSYETLPHVTQSLFTDLSDEDTNKTILKLSEVLGRTQENGTWVAILTGLGLATMERYVVSFMDILERHGVQRAQWALASMFSDSEIDMPELKEFEQWQIIRGAVCEFRAMPKHDLRRICLEYISQHLLPSCQNFLQANKLLSCFVPICGGEPIKINIPPLFIEKCEQKISEIAALLSTAYLINPTIAIQLVDELGGEGVLLDKFKSQTPWITAPIIDPNGEHGRTVRSNINYISDLVQSEPNEAICNICETLIAISPQSEAAASEVLSPLGNSITIGEFSFWTKNMPRQNIPAKTRVAWNVAFRQILLARSTVYSLTSYTHQMADLVKRTEKVFRFFTEKWIKGKHFSNGDALAEEINEIISSVNVLAYAVSEIPTHDMTAPLKGAGEDDSLGSLLIGTLGNLLRRMNKIPGKESSKGAAAFAGSLAKQAQDYSQSPIWRTSANPPLIELNALAERLINVSNILHEFDHDDSQYAIQKIIVLANKSNPGRAVSMVAKRCYIYAEQRLHQKIKLLENALEENGWSAKCWLRPINKADCVYWPAMEVAITVNI